MRNRTNAPILIVVGRKFHWKFTRLRKTCREHFRGSAIGLTAGYSPVNKNSRFGNAGLEQLGEMLGKDRPAEIVTLRLVTEVSLKKSSSFKLPGARLESRRTWAILLTSVLSRKYVRIVVRL
jgi:hypothetical protein